MTIGRTVDPENPFRSMAFEAAGLLGTGSRNPSGPAAMTPRQQAGHMTAIDMIAGSLVLLLHSKGRPHMTGRSVAAQTFEKTLVPSTEQLAADRPVKPDDDEDDRPAVKMMAGRPPK